MERQQGKKDKSVAWFKLAELIARGEREKALSVFRLLSHSLSDRAYALQVEADILWYMNDRASLEKYKQAAFLYQKEQRWVNAIAIYQHLSTQYPELPEIVTSLAFFYAVIDSSDKFQLAFNAVYELFQKRILDENELEKLLQELVQLTRATDKKGYKAWLRDWLMALPTTISLPAHMQSILTQLG